MSDAQIQAAVAAFAAQLETLVREKALAAVIAALGGSRAATPNTVAALAAAPKKRGRPTKAAAAAKAAARSPSAAAPAKPRKGSGKRVRRSADQIEAAAKKIAEYVSKNPGSGAEHIKKGLSIADNQWGRPIALALESKQITAKGHKRATRYWPGK